MGRPWVGAVRPASMRDLLRERPGPGWLGVPVDR